MKSFIAVLMLAFVVMAFVNPLKPTIFMIGDSTMANKQAKAFPETGWGQVLGALADTSRIQIDNHARNGRSTKSFTDEGLWAVVVSKIQPGDYVFIQFGHNDEKKDKPNVYARAETSFRINLKRYIDETKAKGGIPVLFTSIVRYDFEPNGKLRDTHGAYIAAAKEVAAENGIPLIDLEAETHLLLEKYGPEAATQLFVHALPGDYDNYPEGKIDNTHLNRWGAIEVAQLAVKCIKKQIPALASYF